MKRVFTDVEGINPNYETSKPEWGDRFRAPTYSTVVNPDFDPEEAISETNQPALQEEVVYTETRPYIDMPDDTDVTKLIVEGGVARTMTSEEIVAIAQADAVAEFKAARPAVIQAIKVTVDGMVFDGDEISQTRMSRAAMVMNDIETTLWVLANNTLVQVTKAQLLEALKLSGQAQTALWVM